MSETLEAAIGATAETPLTAYLDLPAGETTIYQGSSTPKSFGGTNEELAALTSAAGIYDLGYTSRIKVAGNDRVRWLNGMVSNNIRDLAEGCWNYSFVLNPQGRIQGDLNSYRTADILILETSRAQVDRLSTHLRRFIIMDEVELQPLDEEQTAIGIAGPKAPETLAMLGIITPEEGSFASAEMKDLGVPVVVVHAYSPVIPRFELWLSSRALPKVWTALKSAGATPCGVSALEALRVLEGTPLFGVDIQDRNLAQETSQARALNFKKGCYLGQEIVERIRSRASIHRALRQLKVDGAPTVLTLGRTIELQAEGAERNPVGEITSLAHFDLPSFKGTLALGMIRSEVMERALPLTHSGGATAVLDALPALS